MIKSIPLLSDHLYSLISKKFELIKKSSKLEILFRDHVGWSVEKEERLFLLHSNTSVLTSQYDDEILTEEVTFRITVATRKINRTPRVY